MRRSIIVSFCWLALTSAIQDDVGYSDLFEDALDEAVDAPLDVDGQVPDWLDGVFFQTGPARWSVGDMKFTHALDGFGKVHKWAFHKGQISFTSKFVGSQALNQSLAKGEIIWGVLAQETEPPRKNPGPAGFMKAPNDNNNVNPWLFEQGHLTVLSDTPALINVDPETLNYQGEILTQNFTNASNPVGAPVSSGASAHPHCAADGSYVGLRQASRLAPVGNSRCSVYKLHPDKPSVVQDIVHFDVPKASYTHSFGLTKGMQGGDYAVVAAQPVFPNMMKIMAKATLKYGFEVPSGSKTVFHLLPMDSRSGKKQISVETDPFYFGHFLNTWSPGPGKITFDLDHQSQIFFDRFSFDVQTNKTKRDNWAAEHGDAYSTPTRYEVDVEAGTVTSHALFPNPKAQCAPESKWCEFDLFKLHPEDYGRPYCGFWSQQVFFNSSSFASQGVVRAELCGQDGPKVVANWYQPNAYPGEVQFVPKPGSQDKTEGVLLFKIYEGDTKLSKIIVADAKTLTTLASATLPVRIPFTVHGNFYFASQMSHCIGSAPTPPTPPPAPPPPAHPHYGKPPCLIDEDALEVRGGRVCAPKCKGMMGCPADRPAGASKASCDSMMLDFKIPKNYCVIQCSMDSNCGTGAKCQKRNPMDIGVCIYAKNIETTSNDIFL